MEEALVQQIVGMVGAAYLSDNRNSTTNSINDTVTGVLTVLQENYGQLTPHELLEREEIVRGGNYNPCDPITTMFSSIEELLAFADVIGTSYTQLQAINIAYVIFHQTGKFGLAVYKWNRMPAVQITWVSFKQFFRTSHRDLIETSNLTVEDAVMHHSNMVCDVVAGLQEALQQDQTQTENLTSVQVPVDHVDNTLQSTHKQLATQLQKMQLMMQTMQMHYNSVQCGTHQDYGGRGYHGKQSSYSG